MRQHRTTMCSCTSENLEVPRCAIAHMRSARRGASRNDDRTKTPRFPGAFSHFKAWLESNALRGGLLGRAFDHGRGLRTGGDRNAAGLLGLGNLANEIDVEQ